MPRMLVILISSILTTVSILNFAATRADAQFEGRFGAFELVDSVPAPPKPTAPDMIDDATLLSNHGIEANKESLESFLIGIIPDEGALERGRLLIQQLGDASYEVRTKATTDLLNASGLPDTLFLEAIASGDPEQAFRCQQILDARNGTAADRLRVAVFRSISKQKTHGLIDRMVAVFPLLSSDSARVAAARAIKTTAEKQDVATLIRAVDSENSILKIAALESLITLSPDDAARLLENLTKDEDETMRLETARLYAELGRDECLDILVELLDAKSVTIRSRASIWLRRITGKEITYPAWESKKVREPVIAEMKKWIADNRDGMKIGFESFDPKFGRILVGLYGIGKVVEFDMHGKQVWEAPLPSAFCCQGLPNGHRLVGQYTGGRIVEYDAEGKLFKEFANLPTLITSVQRLENGNTLVAAGRTGDIVFEIDPEGERTWEVTLAGTPIHASQLKSGKIMVCFYASNKVCEIDRDGTVAWEIAVNAQPYSASRLDNGNTLVAHYNGGLIEYNPEGEKVREFKSGDRTYSVEMMDDGNLIYADSGGISIINPTGQEIRKIADYGDYLYISHY